MGIFKDMKEKIMKTRLDEESTKPIKKEIEKIEDLSVEKETLIEPFTFVKYTNNLLITFTDGYSLKWDVEVKSMCDKIIPWIRFYKWFFERESEYYMFHHKTGCILITRNLIKYIKIEIEEETLSK